MASSHKCRPRVKRSARRSFPHIPGSDEWRRELARVNPLQAAYTAAVFVSAGTTHCCQVCGDVEAVRDYLITSPDCARMLARFCDNCRAIQASMYDLRTGPPRPLPPEGPGGVRGGVRKGA